MDSLHALSNFGVRFIICEIGLMVVSRKDNMAERRFYVQSGVNISHTTKMTYKSRRCRPFCRNFFSAAL